MVISSLLIAVKESFLYAKVLSLLLRSDAPISRLEGVIVSEFVNIFMNIIPV